MKRRLIALLLAGAMVATALVGCGSKSDDSASGTRAQLRLRNLGERPQKL